MARIESLTAEQAALVPRWHEEWLQVGMCEQPVDRPRATNAIRQAYALIGKPEPLIVFCESPATSSLGVAVWPHLFGESKLGASLRDSLGASLRDSLRDSLGDSLGDSLRDSLGDSLGASLRDSLWASLWDSLRDSLWASLQASLRDSLGDSLRASLRDSLWASLWDSLRDSLWDSLGDSLRAIATSTWFWGQHDAYWVAFYRFCAEIGVQYKPDAVTRLAIMEDLSRSCGWIYFYENVCFVSGRPKLRTELIKQGRRTFHRLHCEDGPAMSFADGFAIYAWHGVRIPNYYYIDSLTAQQILSEENAEVRRALIERYDFQRQPGAFMAACGARVLDTAIQPMREGEPDSINELIAIDLPGDPDGSMVAVKVIDPSTGRQYVLRVHPELRPMLDGQQFGEPQKMTVRNAIASTFGMRGEEYLLSQET